MYFHWTDERVAQLKKMWADGLTASQCAYRFGEVTRSAVIGKVHRLGLAGRRDTCVWQGSVAQAGRRANAKPKAQRAAPKMRPKHQKPTRPPGQFNARRATPTELDASAAEWAALQKQIAARQDVIRVASIVDLEDNQCRWPIGEPTKGFCADTKVPGSSYCACHLARSTAKDNWHLRRIDNSRPAWAALEITETVAA